jgi:FlaA1/EpsC-like NDP-sugar epimerase
VIQAGAMGQGGEVFILDMGRPVKIVDLARDLITLSGFKPDEDIEIAFSGVRPGEKLFEELSTGAESADKTKHPKIFIGRVAAQSWSEVELGVERLIAHADSATADALRAQLSALVPEYVPMNVTSEKPATSVPHRKTDQSAAIVSVGATAAS